MPRQTRAVWLLGWTERRTVKVGFIYDATLSICDFSAHIALPCSYAIGGGRSEEDCVSVS